MKAVCGLISEALNPYRLSAGSGTTWGFTLESTSLQANPAKRSLHLSEYRHKIYTTFVDDMSMQTRHLVARSTKHKIAAQPGCRITPTL